MPLSLAHRDSSGEQDPSEDYHHAEVRHHRRHGVGPGSSLPSSG